MEVQDSQLKIFRDNLKFIHSIMYDESVIIDNKLLMQIDNKWYRTRMPSQHELAEAEDYRNCTQVEYLQKPGGITEENLKRKLKENDVIDIYALEEEKNKLLQDIKDLYPSLATKFSDDEEAINKLETKIENIELKLQEISYTITKHLAPSLEFRIKSAFMEYLTFLCTEQMITKDEWKPLWKSFDEFQKEDSILTQKFLSSMIVLFLNRKEF